jgi:Protein of unknown function (DUF3179)
MKYRVIFIIVVFTLMGGGALFLTQSVKEHEEETLLTVATPGIPSGLVSQFPLTDWSKTSDVLKNAISGGPRRDGIPALERPTFIPISQSNRSDDMNVIVLSSGSETKVYPYNILTWHEIINDTIDGRPVAVTFCPLCGSAIVYDRTLPDGTISTFGVSGFLLESNMLMYDRQTESLWQQSTGMALAGMHLENKLQLVPFQLMSLKDAKQTYPSASIVSEQTGHTRDYEKNPYAGYETNNQFVFEPTNIDATFPPKTIMVVFYSGETPITVPWLALREKGSLETTVEGKDVNFSITPNGELTIKMEGEAASIPFYFEMWFSVAAQHGDRIRVITI